MIRKLLAVGALVLATMCLTAPASYADVVLDPVVTVDHVAPTAFELVAVSDVFDITAPMIATLALPSSGAAEKAACDDLADFALKDCLDRTFAKVGRADPLRIDDVGWCPA